MNGIDKIKNELVSIGKDDLIPIERPSASIVIIRDLNKMIEVYSLGDCSIIIENTSGDIEYIHDNSVTNLDDTIINKMIKVRDEHNLSLNELRSILLKDLYDNRLRKNTSKGYWILELDKLAIKHGIHKMYPEENVKHVAIFSDGFAEYVSSVHLAGSWNEFMETLKSNELSYMLKNLRKLQEDDSECIKYPRLKVMDDASLLLISFRIAPYRAV